MITRLIGAALVGLFAVGTAGQAAQAGPIVEDGAAYFVFTDGWSQDEAVVSITDPAKIEHARALLSGETQDEPHIMGRIVKRPAPYNPQWSFHIQPDSVQFFNVAIEVCDSSISYTEDHLDEAGGPFLPGLYWCPWNSRLVRELPMG
ncbi:Calmodulin-binding protein [Stackebrandtia soli]